MYRPLDEKSPPVGGFSLSVAAYVVNARAGKFKCKKKCKNCRKIRHFQQKRSGFMELLFGFEPDASSLPIIADLLSLVAICRSISPQTLAAQRIRKFSCSYLSCSVVTSRRLFLLVCCAFCCAFFEALSIASQTSFELTQHLHHGVISCHPGAEQHIAHGQHREHSVPP